MTHIINECGDERSQAIIAALADAKPVEVAERFKVSISTVYRIARVSKNSQSFDISVYVSGTICPVAKITTAQGFRHACKVAVRKWGGVLRQSAFSGCAAYLWKRQGFSFRSA